MSKLAPHSEYLSVTLDADLELAEKYSVRSGGERKRTDLVILLSLFELVRQQSRYNSP
jgi:hypothetical protein